MDSKNVAPSEPLESAPDKPPRPFRATTTDAALFVALASIAALWAFGAVRAVEFPAEDGAMLMRYADHLGHGHGIVWNIGDAPVEGGTDFLVLVLVAGLVKLGASVLMAMRALTASAHVATIALMYGAARVVWRTPPWIAAAPAAFVAVGPAAYHVSAGFAAPVFALFTLATWLASTRLWRGEVSRQAAVTFAALSLVSALVRPEGVFIALLCLGGVVFMRGGLRASSRVVLPFLLVVGGIGGVYFVWRASYFGNLLPLPYARKGHGTLHFTSLWLSANNMAYLTLPILPVLALGAVARATRREALVTIAEVIGFLFFWILITNEQNYFMRYEYPMLPIAGVMAAAIAGRLVPASFELRFGLGPVAAELLVLALSWKYWQGSRFDRSALETRERGMYQVAVALRKYAAKGYTIAVSEGGILPLVSEWRAIDAWGLNDRYIAEHDGLTEEYLDQTKPEVIMYENWSSDPPAWRAMVEVMRSYARKHDYVLAADYRSNFNGTQSYFIKRDFADSAAIAASIRDMDYGSIDHRINIAKISGIDPSVLGTVEAGAVWATWK